MNAVLGRYRSPRRAFECRCGKPIFFRNDTCLACGTPLGYDPDRVLLRPLEAAGDGTWRARAVAGADRSVPLTTYRRCGNFSNAASCNWLIDGRESPSVALCRGCRLVRTTPDPSIAEAADLWARTETAKQAVVAQLISLGLPVKSKVSEDPERGVMFDLLRALEGGPRIVTGHRQGLITLDVAEADDAHRERVRKDMQEPYRTLIGHVRHELGHYYWERLVRGTDWEQPCRALFGDERADYAMALQTYHAQGGPADWRDAFVSEYATAHPNEDWAETWAHYLHMTDAFGTARSFGLRPCGLLDFDPFEEDVLTEGGGELAHSGREFLSMVNQWTELTVALNQVTRSMGEPDFYPFVLSRPAIRKLHFVHRVVEASAAQVEATAPDRPIRLPPKTTPAVRGAPAESAPARDRPPAGAASPRRESA